jgi:hypothetical protein
MGHVSWRTLPAGMQASSLPVEKVIELQHSTLKSNYISSTPLLSLRYCSSTRTSTFHYWTRPTHTRHLSNYWRTCCNTSRLVIHNTTPTQRFNFASFLDFRAELENWSYPSWAVSHLEDFTSNCCWWTPEEKKLVSLAVRIPMFLLTLTVLILNSKLFHNSDLEGCADSTSCCIHWLR